VVRLLAIPVGLQARQPLGLTRGLLERPALLLERGHVGADLRQLLGVLGLELAELGQRGGRLVRLLLKREQRGLAARVTLRPGDLHVDLEDPPVGSLQLPRRGERRLQRLGLDDHRQLLLGLCEGGAQAVDPRSASLDIHGQVSPCAALLLPLGVGRAVCCSRLLQLRQCGL